MNHPYDGPASAGLRFLTEVIAWVAAPWAASEESVLLAIVVLVVLVALPSVFSTLGDKRQVIVPTPGPIRVLVELLLHSAAIVAPLLIWPLWLALPIALIPVLALAIGMPRIRWLLRGRTASDVKEAPV